MIEAAPPALDENLVDALCADLRERGWTRTDALIPSDLTARLGTDLDRLADVGRLKAAAIGRAASHTSERDLRGDFTLWLDDPACGDAAADFLARMDALRIALNRRLLIGLESLEAHYALYPPGGRYVRHRDRFRDDDARVLSLVVYLNADWQPGDGGELRLYLPDGEHDIVPRAGTAVLFLSDEIEHEVLVANTTRRSIAGWFRRRPTTPAA